MVCGCLVGSEYTSGLLWISPQSLIIEMCVSSQSLIIEACVSPQSLIIETCVSPQSLIIETCVSQCPIQILWPLGEIASHK